jgi:hypothetical protein
MTPSEAVENADWIGPRLHPFAAYDVGAVVPTGFDAYARILHPASGDPYPTEVRWSEVAAWNDKTIHPEVQFHSIAESTPRSMFGPPPWRQEPRNGTLSDRQVRALAGLLAKHTSRPEACWFCLWDGYGDLGAGTSVRAYHTVSLAGRWARWRDAHVRISIRKPKPRRVPRKRVTPNPQRSYLLFTGSVSKAAGWRDGPNLWWPDDRAWCVASEIDFPYTYVGGSKELIEVILKHRALEALPCAVGDGITYYSDRINLSK